jgi:hypothetical protein
MKRIHRRVAFSLLIFLSAFLVVAPAACWAQLLPPGDFKGKSLDQWTLEWSQWSIATGLGGQTLPDTVDGVKFLPPNFGGGDFVADLTVPQGTALLVAPFFVFGERYDNGTEDNPSDPVIDAIFADVMVETTFDGNVLLQGTGDEFPERKSDVTVFPEPIAYAEPQPRGDINAVAALFGVGIGTIYDMLPLGEHTIRNEYNSPGFFGGPFSFTYNITVVPEPASLILVGVSALSFVGYGRRRRSQDIAYRGLSNADHVTMQAMSRPVLS